MLSLDRPLKRAPFFLAGAALMAAKVAIDALVASCFGRPFSLTFYISPFDSAPLSSSTDDGWFPAPNPNAGTAYWLTVVGVALPFILVGVGLTVRRLRDIGLSAALAGFFFLPFVKFLFFALLALVPSRQVADRIARDEAGPYRGTTLDLGPEPPPRGARLRAVLFGAPAGAGIGVAALGLSMGLMKEYGEPVMIATPTVAGFFSTLVYCRLSPRPSPKGAALTTALAFTLGLALVVVSALDGLVCVVMSVPLFATEAAIGSVVAYGFARAIPRVSAASMSSGLLVLPLTFAAVHVSPPPTETAEPVESEVIVHAPPDVVWKRVIAFPPLPRPTEADLPCRSRRAAVGDDRRRRGRRRPPVRVHDRRLRGADRRVEARPRALVRGHLAARSTMREATLFAGIRPAHLRTLQSTRGQFLVLEPLPDGSTRASSGARGTASTWRPRATGASGPIA